METQLATDSNLSGLDLLFKEQLVTDQNIRLKVSGVFSTVTGLRSYIGSLHKIVQRGSPLSRTARNDYKMSKPSLKLAAGLSYGSDLSSSEVSATLTARKHFQIRPETWLKFMTKAEYDIQGQGVSGLGRVQLTRNIFGFTETQDLRLRVGYEAIVDQKGNVAGRPYGQIRENNWSFNTNFAGWWGVRYDL